MWCSPEPETTRRSAEPSSEGSGKNALNVNGKKPFEENSENSGSDSVPPNDTDQYNEGGSVPLTSQLKNTMKGLSLTRSRESLLSLREVDDEVQMVEPCHRSRHNVALPEDSEVLLLWRSAHAKSTKKPGPLRLSGGLLRPKGKEESALSREDNPQAQRGPVCRENLEATKAIFDLLKEITGLFRLCFLKAKILTFAFIHYIMSLKSHFRNYFLLTNAYCFFFYFILQATQYS